jgi:hypothetical protein
MALTFNQATEQSELVADRHLYLDKTGTLLLEESDAACAFLLCSRGRSIDPALVDGLGLLVRDGWIVQDYAATIDRLNADLTEADRVREDVSARIEAYRQANAVEHAHFAAGNKPYPADMDLERVKADARYNQARAKLLRTTQAAGGQAW